MRAHTHLTPNNQREERHSSHHSENGKTFAFLQTIDIEGQISTLNVDLSSLELLDAATVTQMNDMSSSMTSIDFAGLITTLEATTVSVSFADLITALESAAAAATTAGDPATAVRN